MNIAVTDASKNNSKNDNCKLLLDEEPPKKMEDFFDLLRKSSEKNNRSTFQSIITSVSTPTLVHQHSFKIDSPKIRRQSHKSHAQPEDYIFKFNSQRNEWSNQFDFTENNEEKFDLSPKFYKSNSPPKFKNFSVKFPCFFSDDLMSTKLLDINKPIPQPSEQISSIYEHGLKESSSFRKKHLLLNYNARMKTFLPARKFENEETKFLIPKEKKKIENKFKEQFYQRKRSIYKKERDVFIKKHSLLRSNSRYNTSFKFSPHKYC
uniref:Uncharacterized protein n=2 Tax=Rhodnius prolixus TaxID=13249 RepID=T1HLK7_RHOPR